MVSICTVSLGGLEFEEPFRPGAVGVWMMLMVGGAAAEMHGIRARKTAGSEMKSVQMNLGLDMMILGKMRVLNSFGMRCIGAGS